MHSILSLPPCLDLYRPVPLFFFSNNSSKRDRTHKNKNKICGKRERDRLIDRILEREIGRLIDRKVNRERDRQVG